MTRKSSEKADASAAETKPPPFVLAQAAAAVAGNAEPEEEPSTRGRPNQDEVRNEASPNTKRDHSAYQAPPQSSAQPSDTQRAGGAGDSSHARQAASQSQVHPDDAPIDANPPPAYGEHFSSMNCSQSGFDTRATVASDGRVDININQKSDTLSRLIVPALRSGLPTEAESERAEVLPPGYIPPSLGGLPGQAPPPILNIVIQVVGSRGDVQPFVSLGQTLKNTYGHRVRLATHPVFKSFVEENGLEFFSISGDPAELMAFMVKNPGLMPGFDSMRSGDVGKRRKGIYEILKGCWRSCIEAGDGMGVRATDNTFEDYASIDSGISLSGDPSAKPFVADAIIANPPSFAHIHLAEKLGIPLHMMFTMPWSPTQAFPHPLANVQSSNADNGITNFVSYALVEMMTWQGLGDLINRFRENTLGLESVSLMWAPGMASRLRIPFTYCWSPALIPKPKDWGQHISIAGFYFLSLASSFTPDPSLAAFLEDGPPPVYIGFGSIVVDDPNALTKMIFEAVKKTGVRALVSKGWGGFGADQIGVPENVYMLGNVPHDWLFTRVSCVVHHGGAGTTAAGMTLGKPTVVVPFFGDQPFWGAMIAKAGAGPNPTPYKDLTADKLAAAITEALKPAALEKAAELGARIGQEKGAEVGAKAFHDRLDFENLRCSLAPSHVAVWRVKRTQVRLSALAATVLGNEGLLDFNDLKLYRPREYVTEDGPWEPITGAATALLGTIGSLVMGVADFPMDIFKALKHKPHGHSPSHSKSKEGGKSDSSGSETPNVEFQSGNAGSSDPTSGPQSPSSPVGRTDSNTSEAHSLDPTSAILPPGVDHLQSPVSTGGEPMSPTKSQRSSKSHVRAMSSVMRSHSSRSRSHSRDGSTTPSGSSRKQAEPFGEQMSLEAALGAGKGVGRIVEAGLKSPMDFTLGLARGFHNAPKLYGDKTVRPEDKVTGFQSGIKAATREFGFGFYDGLSGVVTQPLQGAKKDGPAGFVKGFAKGIGGMILKPGAAVWAVPGYTFKGIYKELQKHFGSSVQNYIIATRTAQGYEQWKISTPEERVDIVARWHLLDDEILKSKRSCKENAHDQLAEFQAKHHLMSAKERKKMAKKLQVENEHASTLRSDESPAGPASQPHHQQVPSAQSITEPEHGGFEEAIRASVAATSTGDANQDLLIERAIRASVSELLQARNANLDDEEAMNRAIGASVSEASKGHVEGGEKGQPESSGTGEKAALEQSLQQSLQQGGNSASHQQAATTTRDGPDVDTDDDENVKRALEESKSRHHAVKANDDDDDDELRNAVEASKQAHADRERDEARAKAEEDTVLEYVKKQSLAEAEHRKLVDAKRGKVKEDDNDNHDDDHDEELKNAMEESLKGVGGQTAGESSR
ncbi:MAG: hypothetical protein M1837_006934 [Sclerophora amabilis]|nr:MAG: hypothetical protein M1837_006934 [Sclerophora amabilis]